jgi:Tfp pilus assembly PilM family ATPase
MYFFKDRFKNINNADATIGLDIGSSMIKWVNLGDDYKLKRYAIQSIPMSTGTTYNKNVAQIANRLKKTLLEQDTIKNCIVNIPDVLVCSKWTQVDVADKDTILEAIELLVEQSIPYPLNKLYYDYQIFDPSPESQKFKILIVACRKEHLDFRLDIIHQANLIPIVVEVSSYALERAYSFFYPDSLNEKSILLEIGISQLALLFLNSPQPIVYCENLVIKHDQDSILLQIKRCIKRYFLAYPCLFLKQLFIIGSNNSLLIFLLQELDGFLGLKIQIFKNKNQIKYNPELNSNEINQKFLDLFLSFGLALRINLARQRKKLNSKIK